MIRTLRAHYDMTFSPRTHRPSLAIRVADILYRMKTGKGFVIVLRCDTNRRDRGLTRVTRRDTRK